jgi:hypothetical protein
MGGRWFQATHQPLSPTTSQPEARRTQKERCGLLSLLQQRLLQLQTDCL